MQNVEKIKRDFGLPPGHWQLISHGRLTELPTIRSAIVVTATFVKVRLENNLIVEWLLVSEERSMPAAEILLFDIGCIFCSETKGVLKAQYISNGFDKTNVEVEFTDKNCELIRRYWRNEEGRLLFNNPACELTENSNAYLLSVTCTDGQKILIPCTTVLQTFWGRSSKLLEMLLDTRFLNFDYYVVNMALSKIDYETKKVFLLLRQWSLDGDARFLATIAFNNKAVKRGKDIALRLCAQTTDFQNVDDRYIAAYPPHCTKVVLDVWGLPVKSVEFGDYLFIQRVIKSSYEPEFDILRFDRDNDGRKDPESENGMDDGGGADKNLINRDNKFGPPLFQSRDEVEFKSDTPKHDSTSVPTQLGSFDEIFPNISNVDSEKLPQLETEYINDQKELKVAQVRRWKNLLSTLPGTARSSSDAIHTTIESAKYVRDYSLDTNTSDIKIYLSNLIDAYEDYKKHRNDGAASKQIIKPRFPWPKSQAAGGAQVFSLPGMIQEKDIAWLYSDAERKMRKRAICLEVTFLSENLEAIGIGYIIDIEVRFPKPKISKDVNGIGKPKTIQNIGSTSMVLAWRAGQTFQYDDENNKISDDEIREILIAIAAHGGYTGAKAHFPQGCLTQARKHSANGISFDKLLEELKFYVLGGPP